MVLLLPFLLFLLLVYFSHLTIMPRTSSKMPKTSTEVPGGVMLLIQWKIVQYLTIKYDLDIRFF